MTGKIGRHAHFTGRKTALLFNDVGTADNDFMPEVFLFNDWGTEW